MLMMKKMFFDAIRRGKKTSTLRYWQRQHINPGSVQVVRGLGQLQIDNVQSVNFNELTDDDAKQDGFTTLDELDKTLDEIYTPEQRYSRELFRVEFTFLNDGDATWEQKKTG